MQQTVAISIVIFVVIIFIIVTLITSLYIEYSKTPNNIVENWENTDKIYIADVVYRWINPNFGSSKNIQRYRDNNELVYSLRTFSKVIGLRVFHIIGCGDPPEWLDISHPKIHYHNEQELLHKFANYHNFPIEKIKVANSEVAKYLIPFMEGLHTERFVFVDDDYLIRPVEDKNDKPLTTQIFYNRNGLPYQPRRVMYIHSPIPMKTQDYINLITNTNKSAKEILTSGTNRYDPLREICAKLIKTKKAIPIKYPRVNPGINFPGMEAFMWVYYLQLKVGAASKNKFLIYFHSWGKNMLNTFLQTVEQEKPIYVTINDDWPKNNSKLYKKCMNILNKWRQKHISGKQLWEV